MQVATATASPNIALAKYWGKVPRPGRFPAVPSVSVTVGGISTTTTVYPDHDLAADVLYIDGVERHGEELARVASFLGDVRRLAGATARAYVCSVNSVPTASGLASSASGFAALALGASGAYDLELSATELSDLARSGSASAARSIHGGFVRLDAGAKHEATLAATRVAPATHWDLRILVCVTSTGPKAVSSGAAMRQCASSPYYPAWVESSVQVAAEVERAILERDFERLGECTEVSSDRMHACMLSAGINYWNAATLAVRAEVAGLRRSGTPVFQTMDAGPHVKVLALPSDAETVRSRLLEVDGVHSVLNCGVGGPARLVRRGAR